jgi:hypothetical protein
MALDITTIAALFTAASLGGLTLAAAPARYSGDENANDDRIEVGSVDDDHGESDEDEDRGPKGERKLPRKVSPDQVESALASAQAELSPDEYARFEKIAEHAGPLAAMRAVMKWKHHDHKAEREGKKPEKREKPEKAEKREKRDKPEKRVKRERPEKPEKAEKSERRGKPEKRTRPAPRPGQRDQH